MRLARIIIFTLAMMLNITAVSANTQEWIYDGFEHGFGLSLPGYIGTIAEFEGFTAEIRDMYAFRGVCIEASPAPLHVFLIDSYVSPYMFASLRIGAIIDSKKIGQAWGFFTTSTPFESGSHWSSFQTRPNRELTLRMPVGLYGMNMEFAFFPRAHNTDSNLFYVYGESISEVFENSMAVSWYMGSFLVLRPSEANSYLLSERYFFRETDSYTEIPGLRELLISARRNDIGFVANCYYLNLRSGAGMKYPPFAELPQGTLVILRDRKGGWHHVETIFGTGWVYGGYIERVIPDLPY